MTRSTALLLSFTVLLVGLLALWSVSAQQQPSNQQAAGAPKINRDRKIIDIVREIDGRNIEQTIRKLVSFGTRNTLSEQDNPNRGIGAARDWLYSEFLKAAAESSGRMTVEKQTFEQPKAARLPQPTMVTNVVATLKGSQPEAQARLYVVSGHYDSMCGSSTDAKCDAPGANDDASGTAAVLEIARVMAKYSFEATIIFMAVAVANVARVNAATLASLASAPARPRNVRLPSTRPGNDTDLQWDESSEPDLAGYEVVWRETTAPVWTNSRWVGRVTTFTMRGMSKDNYFFGIRSVDKDGNRSPVSYPRPASSRPPATASQE